MDLKWKVTQILNNTINYTMVVPKAYYVSINHYGVRKLTQALTGSSQMKEFEEVK